MNAYDSDRRTYRRRYCVECERAFWYDVDTSVFYELTDADALEPILICECGVPLTLMRTSNTRPVGTLNLALF